ncbi:MAG: zf-TFIIB domain-containing protein [Campylobacterota bacterium]|nr:zf-TFIIB domain-containing protein [Campylobacterota bacterium]
MPRCSSCSAPLPKSGIICEYCGTRNDIDLRDVKKFVNLRPDQERWCPLCHTQMQTINVGEKLPFYIERCSTCYGIFFDINELESMIENSVKGSRNIDLIKLAKITEHPRHVDIVTYRKCPVCKKTMQRKNFMQRSGVITDLCVEHGIWLDSGELRHIMEWVKTGGMEKVKQDKELEDKSSKYSKRKVNIEYEKAKRYDESMLSSEQNIDLFDILEDFLFSSRW